MTYSCDSDDGFKEPYYDFDSELSPAPRKPRVGFLEVDTPRAKARPKSACSVQSTLGKRERLHSLTRGEGTKPARCSSALGIRRGERRAHSCLPLSPLSDEVLPPDKSCIKNFKRSLKLLGLQLEGFDLGAGESSPKPDVKNAKSKVNSLVTRRTVSLEDLHEAVVRVGFPLNSEPNKESDKHRQVLAKAIYEEWYFKKQEEESRRQSEARQQQKVKQWEQQHRRYEQMRKSQESYSEWLHKKRKQQQDQLRRPRGPTKSILPSSSITPQRAQSAYETWKKEKEKSIKQKQEEIKLQQKMLEENYKKADSERAYQEWKKVADKEWFSKIRDEERKVRELGREEEKQSLEKRKHAEMAYRGWLETKETELKKKIKDARQAHAAVQRRMASRRSDRLYESQQAFLSWLDMVDERFWRDLAKKRLQQTQLADD